MPLATYEFAKFLTEEGLIPDECINVELLMDVGDAIKLRYEVLLRPDDLPKFARAMSRFAEATK